MSRLPLDRTALPVASQPTLDAIQQAFGTVPAMFRAAANAPAALQSLWGSFGALGGGRLPTALTETVAVAIANRNACHYCLAAHATCLRLARHAEPHADRSSGLHPLLALRRCRRSRVGGLDRAADGRTGRCRLRRRGLSRAPCLLNPTRRRKAKKRRRFAVAPAARWSTVLQPAPKVVAGVQTPYWRTPAMNIKPIALALVVSSSLAAQVTVAHSEHTKGIKPAPESAVQAEFDIVHSKVTTEGNVAVFHMAVSGQAGDKKPTASGALGGSRVFSYVWPTTLDSALVGFASKAGILAFAVTAHPDFDDTPLFDENGDGNLGNDGNVWHSHWVVLAPDSTCGENALKVVDIEEGTTPRLPKTWPGLPILIDSPGWSPVFDADTVEVRVPFDDIGAVEAASFDGVTAALRVNESVHNPLLCVADVFKIASGDLSLPGRVNQ